jgi:hypothetical protein
MNFERKKISKVATYLSPVRETKDFVMASTPESSIDSGYGTGGAEVLLHHPTIPSISTSRICQKLSIVNISGLMTGTVDPQVIMNFQ